VDGVLGSCATDVTQGQLLQILDASLPHASSRQQAASTGNSSRIAAKQQQQPWQQLEVLYIDEHLAVVVKPFGLHIYGRGTGHLKHWLSQAIPASTAGRHANRHAPPGTSFEFYAS
jgi:23S rRNA-/tRNA-specific pseudouridylate synthase